MATRMLLTINYKNGNSIKELIHYLTFDGEKITYAVDRQVHSILPQPISIPIKNIESYELTKVECKGWKYQEDE